MAFGSELIMMAGLGYVVLGPKRMHSLLGQLARIRSEVEKASREMKSQLAADLNPERTDEKDGSEDAIRRITAVSQ
jgi:Sec-independent protein translocase protein TatA